jgi:hypothetical protein
MGGAVWQWKEPVAGHRYIMGIDVSRGDSEDFTTFCIIDFDERIFANTPRNGFVSRWKGKNKDKGLLVICEILEELVSS